MKIIKKLLAMALAMMLVVSMAVPTFAAGTTTKLVDMHEMDSDYIEVVEDGITDSYGNSYTGNVLRFTAGDSAFVTYDLNGAYDSFDATIVCGENTGSSAVMDVGIFADGEKIYDLSGYTRQKAAETLSLDVSGVGELSIKTTKTDGYDSYLYFVNSTFTKSESTSIYPNRAMLSDLVVIDSGSCTVSDRLFVDVFGDVHNGWTELNAGDKGYVLFNLDKKYVSLTGCIIAADRTGSKATMNIEFYLDDVLVYSKESITRTSSAIEFDIDVTNASVLKISTSKTDGYDNYIYVTDGILKAHEHTVGDWSIQKEATCTEGGEKVRLCTTCNEVVVTEKIEATGHTPSGTWEYSDDGTCNKVQYCTVCGEVAERQTDEDVEHTASGEWVVTEEARCDAEGEQVQYCSVCGEVAETEVIPTTEHEYGKWETISGNVWNNPIVKERICSICGNVEHTESNSTSWVKPFVIILFIILFGGIAVIIVTLKMNGLALEPASIKKLFSKESLTDDDINDILNKSDDDNSQNS